MTMNDSDAVAISTVRAWCRSGRAQAICSHPGPAQSRPGIEGISARAKVGIHVSETTTSSSATAVKRVGNGTRIQSSLMPRL